MKKNNDYLSTDYFINPILKSAHEAGELSQDNFRIIYCPHKDEPTEVVALIDDEEENGFLCLHNCGDDGSHDFHDVSIFRTITC